MDELELLDCDVNNAVVVLLETSEPVVMIVLEALFCGATVAALVLETALPL